MSQYAKIVKTLNIGSTIFSESAQENGDAGIVVKPSGGIPAAKVGQLTTRTSDVAGVITAVTGHGIISTNKIDIYWTGGARYGVTATVAGDAITLADGSGDNLPANLTNLTFMKPHVEVMVADGDDLAGLATKSAVRGRIAFLDGADAELYAQALTGAQTKVWVKGSGETNPVAGDSIAKVTFSHGDTTAKDMVAAVAYN